MRRVFLRFLASQSGATATDYGLIAAGISLAIIAAVNGLSRPTRHASNVSSTPDILPLLELDETDVWADIINRQRGVEANGAGLTLRQLRSCVIGRVSRRSEMSQC